jgi:hypothetical protein
MYFQTVIPASEARRESDGLILRQAGMTVQVAFAGIFGQTLSLE